MNDLVALQSSHIFLKSKLVERIFKTITYAYVTYIKQQDTLLITPVTSLWFVKMYEPTQFLLKTRNLKGDKTLAIREILIDNDLDTTDRMLDFEVIDKTNLIKIQL